MSSYVKFLGKVITKKGQKEYYKEIMIGPYIYSVGNFVHLKSDMESNDAKPYIGLIRSFYKVGSQELMRVRWLFRTEDTHLHSNQNRDERHEFGENEVFFSRDEDENDVKTIMQRVYVYPDGSPASKSSNPSRPVYSCCLEYLPSKKKFKPLLDTSVLSKPPKMKPTFDDDVKGSKNKRHKKGNRQSNVGDKAITSTISSSSAGSSTSRSTETNDEESSEDNSSESSTGSSSSSSGEESSSEEESDSDSSNSSSRARSRSDISDASDDSDIAETRIGPEYQATNIPD